MDTEGLEHLLNLVQDGVVSRRQLRQHDVKPHELKRMLRRRELAPVHRGVFVNHTGPLTWDQRAWAAVLVHWPAALARESALPRPPQGAPIQVAIDVRRSVRVVAGVVAHRTPDFQRRVQWIKCPPRMGLEDAAIDVALSQPDVAGKFRVFADATQTRETTAAEIAAALERRPRVAERQLLRDLLDDLATGATSVLERGYLELERRHGLPAANRQAPAVISGRRAYRDVPYEEFGLFVELDGRPFHDTAAARDADADRDLESVVASDALTVRLTYGQVFRDGCRTVERIATLLQRRGWKGGPIRCAEC